MRKDMLLLILLISFSKVQSQPPPPTSFSWNGVDAPDQKEQGPCQAFAVVAAMENWQRLLYGHSIDLSEAHIYSPYVSGATPLGVSMNLSLPFLKAYGVVDEIFLNYTNPCNAAYPCPPSSPASSCYFNNGMSLTDPDFIDIGTPWKDCIASPSNPDQRLPNLRYRVGDFEQLSIADFNSQDNLKRLIMNYGPIPFGTDNVYPNISHAFCLYGWDANGNWLLTDSWPNIPNSPQRLGSVPISTNFTGGSYFLAYRLKKSIDDKPAVYRQQRVTNTTPLNNWVDDIQTVIPITSNNSLNEVFKIDAPSYVTPSGTFSIPGLQHLNSYSIDWSYETVTGTGAPSITNNGSSAYVTFSNVSTGYKAKITATITWPNGIKVKVLTAPIEAITYTIAKTHNWCLNTNKREIQYAVTANPVNVNLLLTGTVYPNVNSTYTSTSQGSTFTFTITTTLPNSCGVFLVVRDPSGLKLGEHTMGEYLAPCSGGYRISAGGLHNSINVNNSLNNFLISPNPAKEKLTILSGAYNNYTIHVLDIYGRKLITTRLTKSNEINISTLMPGIYFLKFIPSDKSSPAIVRFVKE